MSTKTPPSLNKSHNFGVFLKKGKRGILQEDLHISLRFVDGDLDFDADTTEEKYAICRLLDAILEAQNSESDGFLPAGVNVFPPAPIIAQNVLKDGVLEKKGNTTITTWNRRRVRISVGEFSYFKPGEELALNVVQLRQDRCRIQRIGQNTIDLKVNQRTYCFRIPNDSKSGLSVETVRDDWIKAFDQAMTMKRAAVFPSSAPAVPPPDYEQAPDSESASDVSSMGDSPFIARKELDTGQSDDQGNQEITASVSVHFSYNKKAPSSSSDIGTATGTTLNHPKPKSTKRGPVYPLRRNKEKQSAKEIVSRPHPDCLSDDPVTALTAKFIAHSFFDKPPPSPFPRSTSLKQSRTKALDDRVLAHSDLGLGEGDAKVISRKNFEEDVERSEESPVSRVPGKGRKTVFDVWKDAETIREKSETERNFDKNSLAKRVSRSFKDDSFLKTGRLSEENNLRSEGKSVTTGVGNVGGALVKANSMSDLLDVSDGNKKYDVKRPAPPPPSQLPTPPPTAPTAPTAPLFVPPPPPTGKGKVGKGGIKLKQVHWTAVEKKRVSASLWGDSKAHVPTLDFRFLESMFSVYDKEKASIKTKAVKQTLLDTKRAQNFGILFSGFKDDCLAKLLDALGSVTEPESFQLQKMATLKRFQPTADDTEMFKMYRRSRDSLAPVDRFMLDLCEIPKLSVRIDLALALWDLPNNYAALQEEVDELLGACKALLSNTSLPVVLRCMLSIGNHLNAKRQSKDVPGFQISSVDKMVDLKGTDPHYSVMTYLVEQLTVTRPDLLDWTMTLDSIPKVVGYSVKAIGAEIDVLKNDLQKVKKYHKTLKGVTGVHKKFMSDVQNFVSEYEKRVQTIHDKSEKLKHHFTQLLTWLGEPATRTSDVLFSSLALLIDRFHTARARLTATTT
ncbi:formin-like protein 3 [Littorina saxatilis]|uniref:formin-like protein 3 n=1 Tax=Littorina saxatilis TaxID=31220 RepID=UPI0038B63CC3